MNKSDLQSQYHDYTTEYLLQLRARGDGLSDEAHTVIEEIIESRGETVPPKPKSPVAQTKKRTKNQERLIFLTNLFLLIIAHTIGKLLHINQTLMIVISVVFIVYSLYNWNKKRNSTPEDVAREEALAKIGTSGFTELMFYASEGNLDRVQDIVNYTNEINTQDHQGGTALMYASKNGHASVVEFLLKSKANPMLKTKAGSSALDFAKREGHEKIVRLLSL